LCRASEDGARVRGGRSARRSRAWAPGLRDARVSLGENSSVRECVGTRSRVCDEARGCVRNSFFDAPTTKRGKKFGDRYFLASA
jgi:hypothetical protein